MYKKGFTLVEVMVALAVLAIISAAVLGTFLVVNSITLKNNDKLLLGYSLETVTECYYNTADKDEFLTTLKFNFGDDGIIADGDNYKIYFTNGSATTFDDRLYVIDIVWASDSLTLSVVDKRNNVIFAEKEYSR